MKWNWKAAVVAAVLSLCVTSNVLAANVHIQPTRESSAWHEVYASGGSASISPATDAYPSAPLISTQRVGFGVAGNYDMIAPQDSVAYSVFAPRGYVSYSLTPNLVLTGSAEWLPSYHASIVRGGGRVLLMGASTPSKFALAAGFDAVHYGGTDKAFVSSIAPLYVDSWTASANATWIAAEVNGKDRLYVTATADYDPRNALYIYRVGLKAPVYPW